MSRTFRWVSSRFSNGTPGSVEIVAAGGKVSSSTVTMLFLVLPSCIPGASSDTLDVIGCWRATKGLGPA